VANSTAATGCKLVVYHSNTASQEGSNVSDRAGDRLSARRRRAERQATLHITLPTLLTVFFYFLALFSKDFFKYVSDGKILENGPWV
jgi:hypothetical protein